MIENFLKSEKMDLESLGFTENDDLHPKFWQNQNINSVFASRLRLIAQNLIEDLDISKHLKDIIITGSIASYNWHKHSDIDLHIILDFEEIDKNVELVRDFFTQKRMNWNRAHNIILGGHEVEIYFQDMKEDHKTAGIYSLVHSKWLQKPAKNNKEIDICAVKCKAESISKEIDLISYLFFQKKYREAYNLAQEIKEKIKKLRKSGLDRVGIFSVENLAFKTLRNNEEISKLYTLSHQSYDLLYSQEKFEDLSIKIVKNV